MTEKEKLMKRLQEIEEEEKKIKKENIIKSLSEYTDYEKIKFFDKLYNNAKEELEELESTGYFNEDNEHYAWETYITILAKDNRLFWDYWNSLY